MNPLILQDELIEELKLMFDGMEFKNTLGERTGLNIFAQNTPMLKSDEEIEPVPYIIVHLNDGEQKVRGDSFNIVSIALVISIYDVDSSNQGHRKVVNMIYKIQERFSKNAALKTASFTGDFNWTVMDTETYPYFFGACEMSFYIPSIRREDDFS